MLCALERSEALLDKCKNQIAEEIAVAAQGVMRDLLRDLLYELSVSSTCASLLPLAERLILSHMERVIIASYDPQMLLHHLSCLLEQLKVNILRQTLAPQQFSLEVKVLHDCAFTVSAHLPVTRYVSRRFILQIPYVHHSCHRRR